MKRYITKYKEDGKLYAEAWDQINIFGKAYTFHRRRIEIPVNHGRWIERNVQPFTDEAPVYIYRCSVCEHDNGAATRYCPNCGAKMDEVVV